MIADYTHALSTDVLSLSSQLIQKYRMKILNSYKSRDPQTPGQYQKVAERQASLSMSKKTMAATIELAEDTPFTSLASGLHPAITMRTGISQHTSS